MTERVTVFFDWQNVYMRAREAFHAPTHDPFVKGQVLPLDLAQMLADRGRDGAREVVEVRIYRGVPDQAMDTRGYAAARRQMASWSTNRKISVLSRTLRYPDGWPNCEDKPREKGVDVALAVDLVTLASAGTFDTAIVMSSDQDLSPAVEYVERTRTRDNHARIEVAAWRGGNGRRPNRITTPGNRVYCHWLDEKDYWGVVDDKDYTATVQQATGPVPTPPARWNHTSNRRHPNR